MSDTISPSPRPDFRATLIAFSERDSHDPMTGEEGILRHEWWLVRTSHLPSALLSYFRPSGLYTILSRYIRRGQTEPWSLHHTSDTAREAIETGIGDRPIQAADPRFQRVLDRERAYREAYEATRLREAQEERAAIETREHKGRQQAAFSKLFESPQYGHIARAWNALCSDVPPEHRTILRDDPEFRRLYDVAIEAESVPQKRKAMREALERASHLTGRDWRRR